MAWHRSNLSMMIIAAPQCRQTNVGRGVAGSGAASCARDGASVVGGSMLRREGVYSSSLSTWRRQREASGMASLAPQPRGPKVDPHRAEALQIAQLTRDNEKLKRRLENAMLVIDVQKQLLR